MCLNTFITARLRKSLRLTCFRSLKWFTTLITAFRRMASRILPSLLL